MIIKELIKEWWDEFKEDLLFNSVMLFMCTILFVSTILLAVFGVKSVIQPTEEPEEKMISIEELKKSCPNIEEKLEEFMGGDITFTEEGQAWINSVCEASK